MSSFMRWDSPILTGTVPGTVCHLRRADYDTTAAVYQYLAYFGLQCWAFKTAVIILHLPIAPASCRGYAQLAKNNDFLTLFGGKTQ